MALRIRRRAKKRTYRRAGGKYRLKRRSSRRYRRRSTRYRRARYARIRRYRRKRRYRKRVRGFYRALRPHATRQDAKIHRHCGSVRWIEHFAPALTDLNKKPVKGDLVFSLVAKITRLRTVKALNALACLITRVPYIRYSDIPDSTKTLCRDLFLLMRLMAIEYQHDRLEPGAIYAEKLARIQLNKQALAAMENMLGNIPAFSTLAISKAKASAVRYLEEHLVSSGMRSRTSSAADTFQFQV